LLEKDEVTQRVDGCSGLGFSLGVHKALYTLMTCRATLPPHPGAQLLFYALSMVKRIHSSLFSLSRLGTLKTQQCSSCYFSKAERHISTVRTEKLSTHKKLEMSRLSVILGQPPRSDLNIVHTVHMV